MKICILNTDYSSAMSGFTVMLRTTLKPMQENREDLKLLNCNAELIILPIDYSFQEMQFTISRTCSVTSAVLPWNWTVSNILSDWNLRRENM